jgi:hypothetical protein
MNESISHHKIGSNYRAATAIATFTNKVGVYENTTPEMQPMIDNQRIPSKKKKNGKLLLLPLLPTK